MVTPIGFVTKSLGGAQKHILNKGKVIAGIARRSMVSKYLIPKGTKRTSEVVTLKRPGTGISQRLYFYVLRRSLNKDIEKDEMIKLTGFV
jgi:N,N'-diacetyllegionaminate synthase